MLFFMSSFCAPAHTHSGLKSYIQKALLTLKQPLVIPEYTEFCNCILITNICISHITE